MSAIKVAEGVEGTPEMLRVVEGRYFLPGERVRALAGARRGDGGTVKAARLGPSQEGDLVIAATWLVRGSGGEPQVAYAFEGCPGLHAANEFGDPRSNEHCFGLLIQRAGGTWLIPLDDRAENVVEASGPPVRIVERLVRSARYSLGLGPEARETHVFFAGLEPAPQHGEFHVLANADGTANLAYATWWTDASPDQVDIAQDAIASAGFASKPAPRN
ncbi:hypothetical protein BHAOGJBA_4260 [Methylobacterium hispanicum]|uniref:Uncharacterized protein n=1 Tax=Methylobacterium hispanicum TaxID=270350 RepID=A0AAV4ZRL3_9HYPH|nr:hypothetical protein [Methylobacterium hispanicum]GJD90718.1 hypothetical protein BHAOGJBA_4260 [Methylobacterium hispanicum]